MRLLQSLLLLVISGTLASAENDTDVTSLDKRAKNGRPRGCDFSTGHYVPWPDCVDAARQWCSNHAGKVVKKGARIDDGPISKRRGTADDYKSGHWSVEMYVKYQNDHWDGDWIIDEEACNWYLNYIAQGCTKGGDKPSYEKDQVSDGGTFYEERMGSVDFQWRVKDKSEL